MNQYVTGTVIKELREKCKLTQAELATKLNVSDKTISKWETAKGYPDISLLEPIAKIFGISITELISGNAVSNVNVSANVMRSKIYVCPVCGSKNLTKIDRMNGYLSYSRVKGDTRLNDAKMAEIAERKSM